jgi:OOP family OmpA-OmpF porin
MSNFKRNYVIPGKKHKGEGNIMKTKGALFFILLSVFLVVTANLALAQEKDVPGSKDHPLFTRMPNFYIQDYEEKEFDSHEFINAKGEEIPVEGHKYYISYYIQEGVKAPSELQIIRNYTNAIKKIGGTVEYETKYDAYLKVEKSGKEIWAHVRAWNDGEGCDLTIIEKESMAQYVVADAKSLAQDISKTGHVKIYGIYFDTDSDVIKPESEPTLKVIADMLKANGSLKVYVVGHTDMTGAFEHNMELSNKRAEAVANALINKHGIAAARLKARGAGPLCPVSENKTEEGRKLNRRVELVEM